MKKSILTTVLLSGLALSAFSTTTSAVETDEGGSKETSQVEVELKEDKGHENGSGPFKDKLAIVHKPTIFKFSGNTTTGSLNLVNKNANKDNQFISVNDDRKVEENGYFLKGAWKLEGQLSELKDGSNTLAAKMNFKPGELQGYNIGGLVITDGVEDYKPATIAEGTTAIPNTDNAKYELTDAYTLEAGATSGTALLSASASTPVDPQTETKADLVRGVSTNLGDVNLAIATGKAKVAGTYTGTITWTLSPSA